MGLLLLVRPFKFSVCWVCRQRYLLIVFPTGYDTTLATSQWLTKFLTLNPRVQEKLRSHLREAFPHHVDDGTMPSAAEIVAAEIPYLHATVEEVARCSDTVGGTMRLATKDTEILGHHIPKGTDVFMVVSLSYRASDPVRRHGRICLTDGCTSWADRATSPPLHPSTRASGARAARRLCGMEIGAMRSCNFSSRSAGCGLTQAKAR